METFTRLFGSLLLFVYHCFDRVVINGYLSGLSRPGQVVHFFQNVVGEPVISKEVLSRRTQEYQAWVEAFARNHGIPMEWAEAKVRKEDYVRPALRRMERAGRHGVYFILKSMEQGQTFRSTVPRFATGDPNYRILARQRSRFTHYYFYIRDERLGPMAMRVASFFPFQATYYLNGHSFIEKELDRERVSFRKNDNAFLAVSDPQALQAAADRFTSEVIRKRLDYWTLILGPKFSRRERAAINLGRFYAVSQVEYCRNFVFKRHFPIHRIFERGCEIGLWRMTANKIAEVFGQRLTRKLKGKLNTVVEQIEHGHHIFRAYARNAFVKQYEKFSTFLRNEVCSNNLSDFGLKKGLDHLAAAREKLLAVTDRFAAFQAQWLNVHVEFPLLQRLALPIAVGTARYPGIKIHDTRMIRLMEVLLHNGTLLSGWRARQIHQAVLTAFHIGEDRYGLNQLRYDLRKIKAHGLLARDGKRYAYRLTDKGTKVALLFLLFHKQLCGPWPTASFTINPPRRRGQTANLKPPSTKLTAPSVTSCNCSKPPENVEVFLFTNQAVRIYISGDPPSGHLYVAGGTGPQNNTLYAIAINNNVMTSGAATAGPELATNYTNGYYAAGLPITEFCNDGGNPCTSDEGPDYLFLGVLAYGDQFASNPCTSQSETIGCAMGFTAPTSGVIATSAAPNGTLPESGGPSGVVIDYSSNIYFSTLYNQTCTTSGGNGGCAISATQSGLQ